VVIQHVIGIPFTLYPIFIYKSTTFFSILPEHFLGFYQLSVLEFEMFSAQEADIEERKGSLLLVFRVTSCPQSCCSPDVGSGCGHCGVHSTVGSLPRLN